MAGTVVSAGIVSGDLIIGLSDGSIINAGRVQGPQGLTGDRGPMGNTGKAGEDGNTILSGYGMPKPEFGRQGDFYIDTQEWVIYGPKSGNVASWGKGQELLADRTNPSGGATHADRWKAGGGRFFPLGGASSAVTVPPAAVGGGLDPIIGNGQPLGANIWSPIAIDATGDLMEVTLYFSRAGGNEVYTCKAIAYRANTIGNLTIAWESAQPQTLPFTVEFDAQVAGSQLTLRVRSNTNWEEVRGRVNML
jgi:hypothetical protein